MNLEFRLEGSPILFLFSWTVYERFILCQIKSTLLLHFPIQLKFCGVVRNKISNIVREYFCYWYLGTGDTYSDTNFQHFLKRLIDLQTSVTVKRSSIIKKTAHVTIAKRQILKTKYISKLFRKVKN